MAEQASKAHPWEIRLQDPLSKVTRTERRNLVAASFIGVVISQTGLVPSKINALGIEFDHADQKALLRMFAAVVIYFLLAFLVYAGSDLVAWRSALLSAIAERARAEEMLTQERALTMKYEFKPTSDVPFAQRARFWSRTLGRPTSVARAMFEFLLPVIIALYAVAVLATTPPPRNINAPPAITAPTTSKP
jgi:hypothetical protein